MLLKKTSNIFMSAIFIFMFTMFIYLPSKQSETRAKPVALCSLTYIVGCDIMYCWSGHFNNYNCSPCGSQPPCP